VVLQALRRHPSDGQGVSLANGVVTMMRLFLPVRLILGAVTLALTLAKSVLPVLQDVSTAEVELKLVRIVAHQIIRRILLLLLAHSLGVQIDGHAKVTDLAHAVVIEEHIASGQISMNNLFWLNVNKYGFNRLYQDFLLTLLPAMYSIPQAMSSANPAKVRGDKGARLRPPGTEAGNMFVALLAALRRDRRRPLMAYSIISMWGSRGIFKNVL